MASNEVSNHKSGLTFWAKPEKNLATALHHDTAIHGVR